jgi:Xaa-Pro aminopeptidase
MNLQRTKTLSICERVEMLRAEMERRGIHAYLIPATDPHLNEIPPAAFRRLEWISGFSGSAGIAAVTRDYAGLWTDGRYHIQARYELRHGPFRLHPLGEEGVKDVKQWLSEELPAGSRIGADPRVFSIAEARSLEETLSKGPVTIQWMDDNLIDLIWRDRPSLPAEPVYPLPMEFSGRDSMDKIRHLRNSLAESGAHATVLCHLDEIAWLFNLRGADVPYTPVFLAYVVVGMEQCILFTDVSKLGPSAKEALPQGTRVLPYDELDSALRESIPRGSTVLMDPRTANHWLYLRLEGWSVPLLKDSPIVMAKAIKNETEREGMRRCHIRDGAALVRFFIWLEERLKGDGPTEWEAARALDGLRAKMELFRGPSFETIVAYGPNGAVVHYRPSPQGSIPVKPEGLLLVDSGGHYLDGTTDVTRTLALGPPTEEQKEHYTRVLKGHIQLATACFPKGTTGAQLEALARRPLWDACMDYMHGTGHGIGAFLSVHEGPHSISQREPRVPIQPGMVFSNEPGYYREGRYGIRIEGAMMTKERESISVSQSVPYYCFEMLTLAPMDLKLVDPSLLTPFEKDWLNSYHKRVLETLSPLLDEKERGWLERATRPI